MFYYYVPCRAVLVRVGTLIGSLTTTTNTSTASGRQCWWY